MSILFDTLFNFTCYLCYNVFMNMNSLITLIKSIKLSYHRLSELSGVPIPTIKNIVTGKTTNPRTDTLDSLLNAIDAYIYTQPEIDDAISRGVSKVTTDNMQNALNAYLDCMRTYNSPTIDNIVSGNNNIKFTTAEYRDVLSLATQYVDRYPIPSTTNLYENRLVDFFIFAYSELRQSNNPFWHK